MNAKLHAVVDASGHPLSFFMIAGQVSDYTGAAALPDDDMPKPQWLLGDRDYDGDWFRNALQAKGIQPCIPGRRSRIEPITYNKSRHRRRSRIEIHVRLPQGMAPGRHPLRPLPHRLLLRHGPCCHHHLLAVINESCP